MLNFDFSDFERAAKKLDLAIDQLPFTISKAMNASTFGTRQSMITAWPRQVDAKNANFARASLRVVPSKNSDLTVEINDSGTGGRALMGALDQDGTKTARSDRLAIPHQTCSRVRLGLCPARSRVR